MKRKTFISHSSKDKKFVNEITNKLQKQNVWYDTWDLDVGDVLSDKIEEGIDESKNFLIILSKNSIDSSWVKYELNMALIKYLENEDYRLIVARIDDVQVPLRLKPFLRVDISSSKNIINSIIDSLNGGARSFKRQFVNRNDEITALQDMFYDSNVKFISLIGFFGIGKSSLIKETLKRTYSNPEISEIILSPAHFGSRLTLELCSKAEVELPKDGATEKELNALNLLSIETLLSKGHFIVFNKMESILDDNGAPNEDVLCIIDHFKEKEILTRFPIIFLSTRWLLLNNVESKNSDNLYLKGLSNNHLNQIISSELERTDPSKKFEEKSLTKISHLLHGYPLAGRLAAPFIVKYGTDYLIDNIQVINKLKIDIAEEILSKARLNQLEIEILAILAIFEHPLNPKHINDILDLPPNDYIKFIDNLVSYNLIETDGNGLLLHPLVNDFYLRLARTSPKFKVFTEKLSEIAKQNLRELESTDKMYVYWLTNACRLLFYCGKQNESYQLRRDLIGELKDAAIKLYQRQEYSTSLLFCNDFLESRPDDKDILFTKARCLSRIGKLQESIEILNKLLQHENNKYRLSKFNYAIGRAYIENDQKGGDYLDEAEKYFMASIRINEHETALQSMGELLFRKDRLDEAAAFIERKLETSPSDPYALSIYSDILWSMGRKPEAIDKIMSVLKFQPKNPNFLFRAGRFLAEENQSQEAYGFFSEVVKIDDSYLDAKLSLADTCLDLGYLDEAKVHIEVLERKVKGYKTNVLQSIKANYYLKSEKLSEAESIAQKLLANDRNVITLGLLSKVFIYKYRESLKKGLTLIAESDKIKAIDLIEEGLKLDGNNETLKNMLNGLQ
ncbi:TIR domain-containing protein [Flagellimonas crocea]|uniref:TIR domain-containing protein n=1 Tax=Flagellimonas crocea TaxID=3067311 RepID=UPI00296E7764|nr:TIR domain-containing protein [Muricauda sp. DH64]